MQSKFCKLWRKLDCVSSAESSSCIVKITFVGRIPVEMIIIFIIHVCFHVCLCPYLILSFLPDFSNLRPQNFTTCHVMFSHQLQINKCFLDHNGSDWKFEWINFTWHPKWQESKNDSCRISLRLIDYFFYVHTTSTLRVYLFDCLFTFR